MNSERKPLLPTSPNGVRKVVVTESPSVSQHTALWPYRYADIKLDAKNSDPRNPEPHNLQPKSPEPRNSVPKSASERKSGRRSLREQKLYKVLETLNESLMRGERRLQDVEYKDLVKRQWQQVALVVDRLLLVLFTILTVGVTVGLLLRGKWYFNRFA